MYFDYLRETYNKTVIENETGVIVFSFDKQTIYIEDLYVKPELRGKGYGKTMYNFVLDVGRQKGCRQSLISVVLSSKGSHKNLCMYIDKLGYTISRANDTVIYLIKPLGE